MNVIKRLVRFSRQHYPIFFVALFASILASLTDVTFLYLIKQCADRHHMSEAFTPMIIISSLLLLVILRSTFNYQAEVGLFKFGRNVIVDLRKALYEKLLALKVEAVARQSSGDLTAKLIYQTEQLGTGLLNISKALLQEGLIIITFVVALLCMNFVLTAIVIATLCLIAYGIQLAAKYMRPHQFAVQNKLSELAHFTDQSKHSIKTVAMTDVHDSMNALFANIVHNHANHQLKINRASALSSGVTHFIISMPLAGIIWLVMVFPSWVTAGDFAALIFGFSRIYAPLKRVSRINVELQSAIAAGDSLFNWFDLPSENRAGKTFSIDAAPGIALNGVNVVRDERTILSNCTLQIPARAIYAFAGETASGKTTLLQVIAGLIQADSGKLLVNDKDIQGYAISSWRKQIGFVDQSLPLFNLSIAENIAFFHEVDIERVKWACHIAAIDRDIEQLPKQYMHMVEYGGSNLSGGQRQRIVLARALYHAKHLLIIDEATSALDNETEQLIYQRIKQYTQLTILLSSHRLAGLKLADQVILIDRGEIIDQGTFDQLYTRNQRFIQLLGEKDEAAH